MNKTILVRTGVGLVLAGFASVLLRAAWMSQTLLPNTAIPQFAQPLPLLTIAGGTMAVVDGTSDVTLRMCEFDAKVLPPGTFAPGVQPRTRTWGYIVGGACPANGPNDPAIDTYIGPVVLATRGVPTKTTFVNELGEASTTGVLAYKYSTDQTLHWADPLNGGMNDCHMAASMGMVPSFGSPCAQNYAGPVPAVPHLHGGEVPPEIDGGPTAWFTSDGAFKGNGYYSSSPTGGNAAVYRYPNAQEAAPLWFHDHTLGATRLNVYAGLAGAYLVKDDGLSLPRGLHPYGLKYSTTDAGTLDVPTVPLVIQDRSFDANGQLFFEAASNGGSELWTPNPEHPYWSPEMVADTILVNGKAWPYLDVEPKRYRFLFLNGSNARTYELFLVDQATNAMGPAMHVIATDGGYLDAPVTVDPNATKSPLQRLLLMPGERYEAIIDFSKVAPGSRLILRNVAKTPYPAGDAPQGSTTGRIMQFRVGPCTSGACGTADTSYNPAAGAAIRTGSQALVRLVDAAAGAIAPGVTIARTRELTLNEIMGMPQSVIDPVTGVMTSYEGGPLEILVNNTKWSGESPRGYGDFTPVTLGGVTSYHSELPAEGATELWEIVNTTADAHPIHLHLVQFQVASRQAYNTNNYRRAYAAAFPGSSDCAAGEFCPGFGPPKDYRAALNPLSGGKDGGNPDVTPYLQGPARRPLPNEAGWKDTVVAYPGEVTRIVVRWAPTDLAVNAPASTLHFPFDPQSDGGFAYVWHCHIIDHEDNEMMRPDAVRRNPAAPAPANRPLRKGIDY